MKISKERFFAPIVIALVLLGGVSGYAIASNYNSISSYKVPVGFPGVSNIISFGNAVAPVVMESQQFQKVANGVVYHTDQYSSFGYTWGPGINSTERIIFFSPDNSSYIVSDIYVSNKTIQDIYFINRTKVHVSFPGASSNYGGYYSEYCSGTFFGTCTGESTLSEVYGNIQIPGTISKPSTGCSTSACAVFGSWTGVSVDGSGANLTQGGISWFGFNVTPPSNNRNGFSLFVQRLPNSPTFITPPSGWILSGNTVNMTTEPMANCANTGDDWYQFWKLGGSSTSQAIGCDSPTNIYYGWYIFESPAGCSGSGCYSGLYQIPEVSSMSFTGNICNNVGTCRNINSNSDPIQGYYIQHNSQDTSTGTISSGGNSWTESWLSSS